MKNMTVCLLGASFDTGNMGVSALAESSIKCILNRWPNAEVTLLASGREDGKHQLTILDRQVSMRKLPIRFCKNVFLPNHFCVLFLYALLFKLVPHERLKSYLKSRNSYFEQIVETDLVADITGGDSFSDLYGMRRFVLGFLCKWLVMLFSKKLVMLPQTYGPFNRRVTKVLARNILNYATVVYSRDHSGVNYVKNLLNAGNMNGEIKFLPDVAFVLDSHRPKDTSITSLEKIKAQNTIVVGLNISGLLFHGGYTRDNMFGLRTNYQELIYEIIELLLKHDKVVVFLIPHVFPPPGFEVESDPEACSHVFLETSKKHQRRVFLLRDEYNQNEIKYIIGLCDFFIGSRMHACIAALSQGIPAIGLAYSKKFRGVFETVDAEQLVVDMRYAKIDETLTTITKAFEQREATARHLKAVIPGVQQQILNVFEDIS